MQTGNKGKGRVLNFLRTEDVFLTKYTLSPLAKIGRSTEIVDKSLTDLNGYWAENAVAAHYKGKKKKLYRISPKESLKNHQKQKTLRLGGNLISRVETHYYFKGHIFNNNNKIHAKKQRHSYTGEKKNEQLTERVNEMTLVGGHTRQRLQVN